MAETEQTGEHTAPAEVADVPPRPPAATLVWVLLAATVLLFAFRLAALRTTAGPGLDARVVTALLVYALPGLISAALLAGAAAGLGAAAWRRRVAHSRGARLATGAASGLLAAAVTGGALLVSGNPEASPVVTAAAAVAVAALLGGLISAVRTPVLAAGLSGALAVAVIQIVAFMFVTPLRGLLDGSGTGPEVAGATLTLQMIIGLVAGVAAGLVSYLVLRGWPPVGLAGQLAAGGAAGAFLLLAEVLCRAALAVLLAGAGGAGGDDPLVVRLTGEARLNAALLVFFAGAITGLVALGRGLSRRRAAG